MLMSSSFDFLAIPSFKELIHRMFLSRCQNILSTDNPCSSENEIAIQNIRINSDQIL